MATKFKTFGLYQRETFEVDAKDWWGNPVKKSDWRYRYKSEDELYAAVAAFMDTLGDRFVAISGDTWGHEYKHGTIIVWYRE